MGEDTSCNHPRTSAASGTGSVIRADGDSGTNEAHLLLENVCLHSHIDDMLVHTTRALMLDTKQREVAETVLDRNKRREAEINEALKQEAARHEAAIKNMHRLRAVRLARDVKSKND